MPYIKYTGRNEYDDLVDQVINILQAKGIEDEKSNEWKGFLNYFISRLAHVLIVKRGLRYHTCNDVIGVLECVKQELYRTVIAPYEDEKRSENGPVSKLDYVGDE